MLNTGRLNPNNLTPSGISPSTSPGNGGSLMARYAVESSKQLASGIVNLGDMGYKTLSRYCPELLPDGSNSPIPSNSGWRARLAASETDNGGMVSYMHITHLYLCTLSLKFNHFLCVIRHSSDQILWFSRMLPLHNSL